MVKVEGESNGVSSLSQLECGPVSTLSPESSFVVIGHGSIPSGEDFNSVMKVDHTSISSASSPVTPSEPGDSNKPTMSLLSTSYVEPKDIQQKLDLVLQENLELKETLHQNNLAMRQQMETLSVWQNEVAKVQQSHSEKFQQTRDLVIKLKAENTELRRQLEKYQEAMEDSTNTNQTAQHSVTGGGIEISKESHRENQIAVNESPEGISNAVELEEERKRRLSEESKSKALLLANTELDKLKKKVNQQNERMEELNKLVKQLTQKLETSERAKRQLEFDLEKAMYGHTDKNLLQLSNENCGLRTMLTEKTKEIETLKRKLEEYTKKLQREQNGEEINDKEATVDNASQELFRERLLEAQSEIEFLRHQLDENQDAIYLREEACSQKAKQIEELHRKIFTLETKLESIPILEAQAEVYQADFHAEREARQKAVSEKENLERILKGSNIQLHTEEVQNNLGNTRNNETPRPENRSATHFCPICSMRFSQVPELERHVDECLQTTNCNSSYHSSTPHYPNYEFPPSIRTRHGGSASWWPKN